MSNHKAAATGYVPQHRRRSGLESWLDHHRLIIGTVLIVLATLGVAFQANEVRVARAEVQCQTDYLRAFASTFDARIALVDRDRAAEQAYTDARVNYGVDSGPARGALETFNATLKATAAERRARAYPTFGCG